LNKRNEEKKKNLADPEPCGPTLTKYTCVLFDATGQTSKACL